VSDRPAFRTTPPLPPDLGPETGRTVIGRRRDVAGFEDLPGFRTCHGRDWSLHGNLAFLEGLPRGPVHLASPAVKASPDREARTFFEWECGWLGLHGHPHLVPASLRAFTASADPCCEALATDPEGFHRRLRGRALAGDSAMPEFGPVLARMAWIAQVLDPHLSREGWSLLGFGAPYRPVLRFTLAWVQALDALWRAGNPGLPSVFLAKVLGEFEPMLDLHPEVFVLPTFDTLSRTFLLRIRGVPIHPLGLALAPRFVDGGPRSPLEFFLHDLDHARYKIREDLALQDVRIPDPYYRPPGAQEATTLEGPGGHRHRVVLDHAADFLRDRPRRPSMADPGARAFIPRLFEALAALPPASGAAARALLFEIVHEKSLPFRAEVIAREAARPIHAAKLRAKEASGFHGAHPPGHPEALESAQRQLVHLARALAP